MFGRKDIPPKGRSLSAIKLVEDLVRHLPAISGTPVGHMNLSDGAGVVRTGGADGQHAAVVL
jgi:hypothetical protein